MQLKPGQFLWRDCCGIWHKSSTKINVKKGKDMTEEEIKEIALKAVKEALEQNETIKKTTWQPERGEIYFTLDGGRVDRCFNIQQEITDEAIAVGQCFDTRKEAEDYIEWLKAFKTLRDDAKGYKFVEGKDNYVVNYDESDGELTTDFLNCMVDNIIHFKSEEAAEESIKKHEKEWKIFYGIED